jgi:hypothetical protein
MTFHARASRTTDWSGLRWRATTIPVRRTADSKRRRSERQHCQHCFYFHTVFPFVFLFVKSTATMPIT